jgi:4-carboxymuconolactone decarboxylase
MTTQATKPRIPPAPPDQVSSLLTTLLDRPSALAGPEAAHVAVKPVLNVLAAIGNHPDLLTGLTPLLTAVATGLLPARDRELVILRVAWRHRAPYEWAHHVVSGTRAGLIEQEISRIPAGPDAPGWTAFDGALLRAVDELRGPQAMVSDQTWQQLASRYDQRQLLELLALIGTYTLISHILNSCGVAIDDWLTNPAAIPDA